MKIGGQTIHFCVITELSEDGNLYDDFVVHRGENLVVGADLAANETPTGMVKVPCFRLGELLILDAEYGRELVGMGRKPKKWFISFELYDDFETAFHRARQVYQLRINDDKELPPPPDSCLGGQTVESSKKRSKDMVKALEGMTKEQIEALPITKAIRKIIEDPPKP